ncbi:SDR family oxidoreductase [Hyphomonas johnsonii]|jgi:NADP-dependent 3-hydroxy acid dehydrogenase YdfG|uniref:Short chain dehydrogenase n=1 Tax=Hyphomonas johnsonii MHS-2 TaxID=1280950 RepID=A0A059FK12_9PROT|nr:SDR family oxidoreductase [Hyphomonas johnsonii]KCZ90828.1 short chain dehydrogenase [Hyphomonas johnsonii MHS-2]
MAGSGGRKSIFITGAASGIGAETARYFADRNWFCGLYDVNEAGLKEVADEIGRNNCHVAQLDVRNRAEWSQAVTGFGEATEGAMNVLFNNAGVGRHGWFEDVSADDNDWVIDVNLKGVINGVHACLPMLRDTPGARIVNTASTAGIVGSPQLAVYSATKFAVRGLTEALDAEFRDLDIRVTSLMPWFIDTPILDMGAAAGANVKMSDQLRENGMTVYPVSMAAERAWEAAHGKDVHYMVGKDAERARFMTRWLPGAIRKRVKAQVPPRS